MIKRLKKEKEKKKKRKKGGRKKDTIMHSLSLSLSHSTGIYRGFLRNTKAMIRQDVAL